MSKQPEGPAIIPVTDVKVGDVLIADPGFPCIAPYQECEVKEDAAGLYVECSGPEEWLSKKLPCRHGLDGQRDGANYDGPNYVGFWKKQS
jgi:hypothetical protein